MVNFISANYIRTNTTIDANVDEKLINQFIDEAEDINIRDVLGDRLYNKIKTDLENNTLTGVYQTLVDDYICKATAYWCMYYLLPFINYKLTNKNIAEKSSDHSDATELKNVQFLMTEVRNKAEYYLQRITIYLQKNYANIPELIPIDYKDEAPRNDNYFGGIYLPDADSMNSRIEAIKNIRYL